jgi:hypothetical protein
MTSPSPLSIYEPICSNCWKQSKEPLLFFIGKELHWACSKRCKKSLIEDEKRKIITNPKILLKQLIKMYVEIYNERNRQ